MLAAPVDALPTGPLWVYEPRLDGFRALAVCGTGSVALVSRSGKQLAAYFPDVTHVLQAAVPAGVVLDGSWSSGRAS